MGNKLLKDKMYKADINNKELMMKLREEYGETVNASDISRIRSGEMRTEKGERLTKEAYEILDGIIAKREGHGNV